jgi:hypothetical protein
MPLHGCASGHGIRPPFIFLMIVRIIDHHSFSEKQYYITKDQLTYTLCMITQVLMQFDVQREQFITHFGKRTNSTVDGIAGGGNKDSNDQE